MTQTSEGRARKIARRVALEQAIARRSDKYAYSAKDYAEKLTQTKLKNTQVRGLETLAYATDRVSAVIDWLKVRVGRDDKRNRWAQDGTGHDLLATLEGLQRDARDIAVAIRKDYSMPKEDSDLERQVHLRLIREYLKHLAAHFEYQKSEVGGE